MVRLAKAWSLLSTSQEPTFTSVRVRCCFSILSFTHFLSVLYFSVSSAGSGFCVLFCELLKSELSYRFEISLIEVFRLRLNIGLPRAPLSLHPDFCHAVFSFPLNSDGSLISHVVSSLVHGLLMSVSNLHRVCEFSSFPSAWLSRFRHSDQKRG